AGFVVAGALCLFWSWLVARYLDRTQSSVGGGK
ncbi:TPA: protein YmfR, partial [Salmonella enterica subsp. enterica serovar 4,[5],12:i:-]